MRRKILLFGLLFLPFFAVFLWAYPHVLPRYQLAVVPAIDMALHWMEPPMRMALTDDGGWKTFVLHPDGTESYYWYRPGKYLNISFIGLAFLPALLLATPVRWTRRLWMVGVGLLLMYALHVLAGYGLVWSIRCLANHPGTLICKWMKTMFNTFGQLQTVVIWGLLTWDVWLPGSELSED